MKRLIFQLLVLLFWVSPAQAAFSFQISSATPQSISDPNQEIEVNLDISDLPSDSYFRVAFQKESGSTYFGQIKNNAGTWVDIKSLSSPCQDYFSISKTASISATILLRIGDGTHEPGDYQIKSHRFTATSCSSTEAKNTFSVALATASTPASSPIETSTSTPKPTLSPSPSPKPTFVDTPKPTPTENPIVLGTSVEATTFPKPSDLTPVKSAVPFKKIIAFGIISLGVFSLLISGALFLRSKKSV